MPVEVYYCEKMVITYTRAALNAFSRYTVAKPLSQDLWGKLTKLHMSNMHDHYSPPKPFMPLG